MKKYLKLIIVFPLVLFFTGCSSNTQPELMTKALLKYHIDGECSTKGINSHNKKLLEEFIINQSTSDKEINVSRRSETFEESTTDNYDVYMKNGEYYIKYKDLSFNNVDYNGNPFARVEFDGTAATLYKNEVPILYEQTHNDARYDYRFIGCSKISKDMTECYGKSRGDNSYIAVQYTYKNSSIQDINMIYSDMYYYEIKESKNGIIFTIGLGIILLAGILFVIYKKKNNKGKNEVKKDTNVDYI